jgi:hypothetical protein
MEQPEDTPEARAAYLQEWEQGFPENLEGYVHQNCFREPKPDFEYTTTLDPQDTRPIVISSHLLQALLEREGKVLADPYGDKKIVSFSHKDKSFELTCRKNDLPKLPNYIEFRRSQFGSSGWIVRLANHIKLGTQSGAQLIEIRLIENLNAQ